MNDLLLQVIEQELENRFNIDNIKIKNNKLEVEDIDSITINDEDIEEKVTSAFSYRVNAKGKIIFILDVISDIFDSKQYKEYTLNNIMLRYDYGDNAYIKLF